MAEVTVYNKEEMELVENQVIDPIWHLPAALSLNDAACLVAGYEPTNIALCNDDNDKEIHEKYPRYDPALKALKHAVRSRKLDANIIWVPAYDEDAGFELEPSYEYSQIDVDETTIEVEDLKKWLSDRDFRSGFFFPTSTPDYLDPNHPNYAPKLAAAVGAWQAVTTEPKYRDNGKTVKTNIESWLTAHAAEFGLVKEDGEINTDAIKYQISKVANWKDKGGAPKTPGGD